MKYKVNDIVYIDDDILKYIGMTELIGEPLIVVEVRFTVLKLKPVNYKKFSYNYLTCNADYLVSFCRLLRQYLEREIKTNGI